MTQAEFAPATASAPRAPDPLAAPFGAFAPSALLLKIRSIATANVKPAFLRRWLYTLFTHFTKKRGWIIDLEYLGGKFRLFIDTNGQDRWVFRRARHPEEEEFLLFERYRDQKSVFVDIGANNGYFAVLASQRLGPGARVLSFEPHPETHQKLLMNLRHNGIDSVETFNHALGPVETTMRLRTSNTADGCNSLRGGDGPGVDVRVRPLLTVLQENAVSRVDILKIDIEGFEDQVLFPFFDSAPESLWPKRVIIERTNRNTLWERDCLEMLKARGYATEHETLDNAWLTRA